MNALLPAIPVDCDIPMLLPYPENLHGKGNANINKNIHFHCARHTFATLAGEIGIPVEVIKELMGHSNINITLGYVKITQPALTKGMKMIDKM